MLKTRHDFTFNKQNKGQICGITVNEIIDEFRTGNVSLSERTDIPVKKEDIVTILSESYDIEGKNVDFNKFQHTFYQKPTIIHNMVALVRDGSYFYRIMKITNHTQIGIGEDTSAVVESNKYRGRNFVYSNSKSDFPILIPIDIDICKILDNTFVRLHTGMKQF